LDAAALASLEAEQKREKIIIENQKKLDDQNRKNEKAERDARAKRNSPGGLASATGSGLKAPPKTVISENPDGGHVPLFELNNPSSRDESSPQNQAHTNRVRSTSSHQHTNEQNRGSSASKKASGVFGDIEERLAAAILDQQAEAQERLGRHRRYSIPRSLAAPIERILLAQEQVGNARASLYDVLGVRFDAPAQELKQRYRSVALLIHPGSH
jgi:hypothetical protein